MVFLKFIQVGNHWLQQKANKGRYFTSEPMIRFQALPDLQLTALAGTDKCWIDKIGCKGSGSTRSLIVGNVHRAMVPIRGTRMVTIWIWTSWHQKALELEKTEVQKDGGMRWLEPDFAMDWSQHRYSYNHKPPLYRKVFKNPLEPGTQWLYQVKFSRHMKRKRKPGITWHCIF